MIFNKRFLVLFSALFGLFLGLTACPVNQETARAIAVKFMGIDQITLSTIYRTLDNDPAFYIFNTSDGFVIVSADDCETPIIGYSHESRFDPNDVPVQMEDYLHDFVARIQYGIENQIVADDITAKQWDLVKTTGRLNDHKSSKAVEPLLTTKWHQGCRYNSLCPPIENQPCGHAEVGCVAVAMGQIMNYWKFPEGGNGSHSYQANTIGTLSATFGNTIYHWDQMPDTLSEATTEEEIKAIATLLYHCGVAVEMNYTANGSGASSKDVPDALKNYFKYSDTLHIEKPNNNMVEWLNKLKNCLDLRRPIYYSGHSVSGHAFVCDGYDQNDLLHFNWGWGGNADGYFSLGHLNPSGYSFNSNNQAIFDIVPNYETHHVSAMVSPPEGGTVEGQGDFHWGQQCHLTAIPADNYHFQCWIRNGFVVSNDSVYSFFTSDDIDDIEAVFSLDPVNSITAQSLADPNNPDNSYVSLSWGNRRDKSWPVLAVLNIKGQSIATNGTYFYTIPGTYRTFAKYNNNGEFIQQFDVPGVSRPSCLTGDGRLFYCKSTAFQVLYQLNLDGQSLVKEISISHITAFCAYDKANNGIWICLYNDVDQTYRLKLVNLYGTVINSGNTLPNGITPNGAVCLTDIYGNTHLLIKTQAGLVYEYDTEKHLFHDYVVASLGESYGCCIGEYQGQTAMFVCYENSVKVFQVSPFFEPTVFDQIVHYRIYRVDEKGNSVMLSDEVTGNSFIDSSWNDATVGLYQYGISEVYRNGNESDITWSTPIPKGNYDINETTSPDGLSVQKVIEDGLVVIIKDGKKFNITGQEIK